MCVPFATQPQGAGAVRVPDAWSPGLVPDAWSPGLGRQCFARWSVSGKPPILGNSESWHSQGKIWGPEPEVSSDLTRAGSSQSRCWLLLASHEFFIEDCLTSGRVTGTTLIVNFSLFLTVLAYLTLT